MSFDLILPFLRPIESLIQDPTISEIMVNGSTGVFIERAGVVALVPGVQLEEAKLRVAVINLARALGDEVSAEQPLLDSRLPDGSRVAAALPPCSVNGTTLTIRKFQQRHFTGEALVHQGSLPQEVLDELAAAVQQGRNLLISGATGTGKTTMLNALAAYVPGDDRLIVIEETAEIQLEQRNLVRLEARGAQPEWPAVTIRDLVRASLRHRPDRIIVGEVRGGEAFDLLQALNTGHAGALSTIHANSAGRALTRFATCVLESGVELPFAAIRASIAESLDLVLHIQRRHGRRVVAELVAVEGYDHTAEREVLTTRYRHPGGDEHDAHA